MRFDVHKVRAYLVNELAGASRTVSDVRDDGTDLIMADLHSGQTVMIHLIERVPAVSDVKEMLTENAAKGLYTLFILWGDMLLPNEDEMYLPDDWMEALYTLYDGKIYGYDSYGPYTSVFPVYFEDRGQGFQRYIRYGDAIRADQLHADTIRTDNRFISGFWRVAGFERPAAHSAHDSQPPRASRPDRMTLDSYYATLAVARDADRAVIRSAYRRLARQYHPDLNDSPQAHERMQAINEAYRRIMQHLDGDV
jgi:hypothetical protein